VIRSGLNLLLPGLDVTACSGSIARLATPAEKIPPASSSIQSAAIPEGRVLPPQAGSRVSVNPGRFRLAIHARKESPA
jgi:hypothetical protein